MGSRDGCWVTLTLSMHEGHLSRAASDDDLYTGMLFRNYISDHDRAEHCICNRKLRDNFTGRFATGLLKFTITSRSLF